MRDAYKNNLGRKTRLIPQLGPGQVETFCNVVNMCRVHKGVCNGLPGRVAILLILAESDLKKVL